MTNPAKPLTRQQVILKRMKRGMGTLIELVAFFFAIGAGLGILYLGFSTAYTAFGYLIFMWVFFTCAGLVFLVYMLGVADEWDLKKTKRQQKDGPI